MTRTEIIVLYNGTVVKGPTEAYDAAMLLANLIEDEMKEQARALKTLGMYSDKSAAKIYEDIVNKCEDEFIKISWEIAERGGQ